MWGAAYQWREGGAWGGGQLQYGNGVNALYTNHLVLLQEKHDERRKGRGYGREKMRVGEQVGMAHLAVLILPGHHGSKLFFVASSRPVSFEHAVSTG